MWPQVYDPLGNAVLSTLLAALPVVVLLGALGSSTCRAHVAALLGLVSALVVASWPFGMPGAHGPRHAPATAPPTGCCRSAGSS